MPEQNTDCCKRITESSEGLQRVFLNPLRGLLFKNQYLILCYRGSRGFFDPIYIFQRVTIRSAKIYIHRAKKPSDPLKGVISASFLWTFSKRGFLKTLCKPSQPSGIMLRYPAQLTKPANPSNAFKPIRWYPSISFQEPNKLRSIPPSGSSLE